MIVVIADDISGAAELAGAALRHGLSAEVQTEFDARAGADVVCVDTDSRSLDPVAAGAVVAEIAQQVGAAKPAWVYKKCDSILRGSVLTETRATMGMLGKARALLVPANPSRGRVIRDGYYFVGEQPLHETNFSRDPEYPRLTSRVADLLGENSDAVAALDAQSAADVADLAASTDDETLPVGGVDFFEALLRRRIRAGAARGEPVPARALRGVAVLACGSAACWSARRDEARARGIPVFEGAHEIAPMIADLHRTGKILIGIGDGPATRGRAPAELVRALAEVVVRVVRRCDVEDLLLEGGATAAAITRALGWSRLRVIQISALGLGVLMPWGSTRPRVFIKPGSYAWPPEIWPGI